MIAVLLAEDQVMFRTAVRRLLDLEEDIDVVGEVGRGDELVSAALATPIEMPVRDGLVAAAELHDAGCEWCGSCRCGDERWSWVADPDAHGVGRTSLPDRRVCADRNDA